MKALIIEDEPRARAHMVSLLAQEFPEMKVVGALGSVEDTLKWLAANPAPDVIFMDVELSDGSSFEIFTRTTVEAPVILTPCRRPRDSGSRQQAVSGIGPGNAGRPV